MATDRGLSLLCDQDVYTFTAHLPVTPYSYTSVQEARWPEGLFITEYMTGTAVHYCIRGWFEILLRANETGSSCISADTSHRTVMRTIGLALLASVSAHRLGAGISSRPTRVAPSQVALFANPIGSFDERACITVTLDKPLGIVLEDLFGEVSGVGIVNFVDVDSEAASSLQRGDVIVQVNSFDVSTMDVDEVLAVFSRAQSPVTLTVTREARDEYREEVQLSVSPPPPPSPVASNLFDSFSNPFTSLLGTPEASEAPPAPPDMEARMAFLRQRAKELEAKIAVEEAEAAANGTAEGEGVDDDDDDDAGEEEDDDNNLERVSLRLPSNVRPGERCSATLPNGRKVAFTAPPGSVPGMIVQIKVPVAAKEDEDREEDEDEEDEDEDEEDDEQDYQDENDEDYDDEDEDEDEDKEEYDEEEEVMSSESGSTSPSASVEAAAAKLGANSELPAEIAAKYQPPPPKDVGEAVGKALLTSLFGESKDDKKRREMAEAEAEAIQATEGAARAAEAAEAAAQRAAAQAQVKIDAEAKAAELKVAAAEARAVATEKAAAEAAAAAAAAEAIAAAKRADLERVETERIAAEAAAASAVATDCASAEASADEAAAAEAAAAAKAAATAEALKVAKVAAFEALANDDE